jgi:iron complex outermembrane receptor protein
LGNTYVQGYRPGGFYANRKWEQTATTNLALDFGFLTTASPVALIFTLRKQPIC